MWFSIAITVLGYGGMFGGFTYIAFTLTEVSGFASGAVPALLVVFGVGLFAGNLLGGRAADRDLVRTLQAGPRGADRRARGVRAHRRQPGAHRRDALPHGRSRLRCRARLPDARHGVRRPGAHPRLGRQHRGVQRRQRPGCMGRRSHPRGRARLHLAAVGGRRRHRARSGRPAGRGPRARRRAPQGRRGRRGVGRTPPPGRGLTSSRAPPAATSVEP
ncbi:hypothetical protein [Nocardioides convexus]|uniref:hypothetical protein n=1 Tax=Nocardioides convexus TaxID=2712224 RepID=UPI0024181634|nr:hypothetical protein [Nocardioides convexus]